MKYTLLLLSPMLLCIAAAAVIAALGQDGWGWFLLVAVLLCPTSSSDKEDAE